MQATLHYYSERLRAARTRAVAAEDKSERRAAIVRAAAALLAAGLTAAQLPPRHLVPVAPAVAVARWIKSSRLKGICVIVSLAAHHRRGCGGGVAARGELLLGLRRSDSRRRPAPAR